MIGDAMALILCHRNASLTQPWKTNVYVWRMILLTTVTCDNCWRQGTRPSSAIMLASVGWYQATLYKDCFNAIANKSCADKRNWPVVTRIILLIISVLSRSSLWLPMAWHQVIPWPINDLSALGFDSGQFLGTPRGTWHRLGRIGQLRWAGFDVANTLDCCFEIIHRLWFHIN